MYHRYAVSQAHLHGGGRSDLPEALELVPATPSARRAGSGSRRNTSSATGSRDWVFTGTDPRQQGPGRPIRLMQAAGVKVLRWRKIRSAANPYDPAWELYLEERLAWKLTQTLAGRGRIEYLWKGQGGDVWCAGSRFRQRSSPGTSTIGSGAVEAAGDVRQLGVAARPLPSADPRRREG